MNFYPIYTMTLSCSVCFVWCFLYFNTNYNNNYVEVVLLSHILQMMKVSFMEVN